MLGKEGGCPLPTTTRPCTTNGRGRSRPPPERRGPDGPRSQRRGPGVPHVPAEPLPSLETAEGFAAHREWEHRLSADRWSVVSWPEEYGGRGASLLQWLLFEEEYYAAGAPGRVGQNGINLLAPTLFEHGTAAQRARILGPMARGEVIWAQAWSEPEAGSDLASLRSTAVRTDGGWLLNGQKTWSSRAAFADRAFGLFRSHPDTARPHQGLSYLMFPLDAPGVTVRPLGRLDGKPAFAELFLDDVFVPDADVLGEPGQGWRVAMSTAGNERGLTLRSPGRFTAYANASRLAAGGSIGAESSLNKVFWSELDIALHETALDLLGPYGMLADDADEAPAHGSWAEGYTFSLAGPVYAGTNEIQRDIVAERLLGLPKGRR